MNKTPILPMTPTMKKDVLIYDFTEIKKYQKSVDYNAWSKFINTMTYDENKTFMDLFRQSRKLKYAIENEGNTFYLNNWKDKRIYITTYIKAPRGPGRKVKIGYYDIEKNWFFIEFFNNNTLEFQRFMNLIEYAQIDTYNIYSFINYD
jgi:hypothetical protein